MARTRLGLATGGTNRIASLSVARSSIAALPLASQRPLAIEVIAVPRRYGDGFFAKAAWHLGHVRAALRLHDPAFFEHLHDLVVRVLDGVGWRHALGNRIAHRLLDNTLCADRAE